MPSLDQGPLESNAGNANGELHCGALQSKLAKALKKDPQQIIPKETTDRELFKKAGR